MNYGLFKPSLSEITDEDLGKMSQDELLKLLEEVESQQQSMSINILQGEDREEEVPDLSFDPEAAPFQRQEGQSLIRAIGVGAQNVPHSLGRRKRELEFAIQNPDEVASGLWTLAKGIGKMGSLQLSPEGEFQAPDDPDVQAVKDVGREVWESISDPERLQEDPTAALANAAAVLWPGLKALQVAKVPGAATATRAASLASDPLLATAKGVKAAVTAPVFKSALTGKRTVSAAGKVAQTGRWASRQAAEVLGITTGQQSPAIIKAFEAGLEGDYKPFIDAINDRVIGEDVVSNVVSALKREKEKLWKSREAFFEEAGNKRARVDMGKAREAVGAAIEREFRGHVGPGGGRQMSVNLGDSVIPSRKGQKAVAEVLNEVFRSGKSNAYQVDTLKQRLQSFSHKDKQAQRLARTAARSVREQLYEQVPGYKEQMQAYESFATFLDFIEDRTSISLEKGVTKRAAKGIRRSISEGADEELRGLRAIEQRTGLPVTAQAAGQRLSQSPPGGLVGRSVMAGLATGASFVGAAFLGPEMLSGLLLLPVFSPRAVGKWVARMGAGARKAQGAAQIVSGMLQQARSRGIEVSRVMTVGQLEQRLMQGSDSPGAAPFDEEELEPRRQSMVGRLGAASR